MEFVRACPEIELEISKFDLVRTTNEWFHPGVSAEVTYKGKKILSFGELHPSLKNKFKIKQSKPVVICVFDKNSMKEYINVQTILRKAGISAEIYPGESKLKKQMEYANKIKSPAVILYGENEIKSGKPTLRNLSSGEEKSIEIKCIYIHTK